MNKKELMTLLSRHGYRKSKKQSTLTAIVMVSKRFRDRRAILSAKMIKLESRSSSGKTYICYASSFYGQIGETEDAIRIGSVVLMRTP